MAYETPTALMEKAEGRAEAMTAKQIEAALKLNEKYFKGDGLEQFGVILQALASNYHASILQSKAMK
jgi:hypothetical protein